MDLRAVPSLVLLAGAAITPAVGADAPLRSASPLNAKGGRVEAGVVTTADDRGPGSLRQAILDACQGSSITFAERFVIDLESEIAISSTLSIDGSSVSQDASAEDDKLVQILGGPTHRIFVVQAAGNLTLRRLRVSQGTAPEKGGGIRNFGQLSVFDSRFDANVSGSGDGLGGGAIFNEFNARLLVEGSSFDANESLRGAAVFNSGDAELRNSSFTGHVGVTSEGAIHNRTRLLAVHITVAGNGGPTAGFGGLFAFNAETTLVNSVFADSIGRNCFASGGTVVSIAVLAESGNCGAQSTQDPELGSLAPNGGPTRTLAPAATSPIIDAGDPELCLLADQRGVARPQGSGCDLGAFEFQSAILTDGFEGA